MTYRKLFVYTRSSICDLVDHPRIFYPCLIPIDVATDWRARKVYYILQNLIYISIK